MDPALDHLEADLAKSPVCLASVTMSASLLPASRYIGSEEAKETLIWLSPLSKVYPTPQRSANCCQQDTCERLQQPTPISVQAEIHDSDSPRAQAESAHTFSRLYMSTRG